MTAQTAFEKALASKGYKGLRATEWVVGILFVILGIIAIMAGVMLPIFLDIQFWFKLILLLLIPDGMLLLWVARGVAVADDRRLRKSTRFEEGVVTDIRTFTRRVAASAPDQMSGYQTEEYTVYFVDLLNGTKIQTEYYVTSDQEFAIGEEVYLVHFMKYKEDRLLIFKKYWEPSVENRRSILLAHISK